MKNKSGPVGPSAKVVGPTAKMRASGPRARSKIRAAYIYILQLNTAVNDAICKIFLFLHGKVPENIEAAKATYPLLKFFKNGNIIFFVEFPQWATR